MAFNDPLSIHQADTDAASAKPNAVEEVLKEHYYRVDPGEYFERRLWGIVALADMLHDSVTWDRVDQESLFGQFQSVLKEKKIALDVPPGHALSSRTMASIESYTLMQHVIETALRLFVAGQERAAGSSPMTKPLNMRCRRSSPTLPRRRTMTTIIRPCQTSFLPIPSCRRALSLRRF